MELRYNIDFSVVAILILLFLLFHYARSNHARKAGWRFIPALIVYVIVLGLLDIATVISLSTPSASDALCFILCTAYMALEAMAAAALTFCLPLLIYNVSARERRSLVFLVAPAVVLAFVIVFVNPSTGIIFSLDAERLYVEGPASYLLQMVNVFYVALSLGIAFINRKHIEPYKIHSLMVIAGMAAIAIAVQIVLWDIRCAVIALAFILMEMYVSLLIPERHFDSLTGIYGRRAFYDAVHRMLQRNPGRPFVLVCLNVKEFKAVNTLYGTEMGDRVLIKMARHLRAYVGDGGACARLHDDRFAFCVPLERFDIDRLLRATSDEKMRAAFGTDVHLMFGIYVIDDPSIAVAIACDRASLALERIADSRVERHAVYDNEQGEGFIARHEIAVDMEKSLTNGDFEVYLQPIVDLRTSAIAAAEALIRWNHPEKGFLPPSEFVPAFEANGLISELDRYVLEAVCCFQSERIATGLPTVPISVNVSRVDITPGFGKSVIAVVDRFGLPLDLVRFEVTESAYVENAARFEELAACLHERGFKLLLDDFGTGYSSLSLLEGSSFDFIKIDRDFLTSVMTNDRARIVARSIVDLAGSLGTPVIIEGIETPDQADLMREMGSEYGQGYHFSKPMPIPGFEAELARAFSAQGSKGISPASFN